MGEVIGALNVI